MAELAGTTVVLADDHAIVREGFAALCEVNGMRVIGQCSDGPTAVDTILAKQPDFVILDLHMPGMTGIEVIRRVRAAGCPSKIMILSISREDKPVIEALWSGAAPARSDQLRAGWGPICISAAQGCRVVHENGSQRTGRPTLVLKPPRDGGVLLSREGHASQGHR